MDRIDGIQNWYAAMCNGDWEHTYGISIGNIDNPGWSLKVEVKDTYLAKAAFTTVELQRQDQDNWIHCKVENGEFTGFCGPKNLNELIGNLLDWSESAIE